MKFTWIIGGVVALVAAYFIYRHIMKGDVGTGSPDNPVNVQPSGNITYVLQNDGLVHAQVLAPGYNDTQAPFWRTDYTPVMQPLVDQMHAYQPYNLRPVYGSIGGPTDYYNFNPVSTYYYDAQNIPDFLLPGRAQYDQQVLGNIRYEQALYNTLSRYSPYNIKGPY